MTVDVLGWTLQEVKVPRAAPEFQGWELYAQWLRAAGDTWQGQCPSSQVPVQGKVPTAAFSVGVCRRVPVVWQAPSSNRFSLLLRV